MNVVRAWFSLQGTVSRRFYVLSGLGLMALKYAGDSLLVWSAAHATLSPLDYLHPVYSVRMRALGPVPDWLFFAMAMWALPFLWIGLTMSARRALQVGRSPWFGLMFAAPLINYVVLVVLSVARERALPAPAVAPLAVGSRLRSAMLGVGVGVPITLLMTLVATQALDSYGSTLFFTTPMVIGAVASAIYNGKGVRPWRETASVAWGAVLLGALSLLLFAIEGIVCLVMALPIAWVAALLGAMVARWIVASGRRAGPALGVILLGLPLIAGFERVPDQVVPHEVLSTIDIAATPDRVWPHVIGFSDLPPPTQWEFQTGIAFPLRATIQGEGVGAVRHCVFSTGPFVEPITAWEPPTRLAFRVASQPPPLAEWSPYKELHPPHLDGYLRSRRGEFRLIALPNGHTRLEGRTWYELDLAPDLYFASWSSWAIGRIHQRVLTHIKALSERD